MVVIVELKGQAGSMLVLLFKEALYMQPGVTADMSALIISQDSNRMLLH